MIKNYIFDFGNVLCEFIPTKITGKFVLDTEIKNIISEVVFDRIYWDKLDIEHIESLEKLKEENPNSNFYYFTTKTDKIYTKTNYKMGDFLVFGKFL